MEFKEKPHKFISQLNSGALPYQLAGKLTPFPLIPQPAHAPPVVPRVASAVSVLSGQHKFHLDTDGSTPIVWACCNLWACAAGDGKTGVMARMPMAMVYECGPWAGCKDGTKCLQALTQRAGFLLAPAC